MDWCLKSSNPLHDLILMLVRIQGPEKPQNRKNFEKKNTQKMEKKKSRISLINKQACTSCFGLVFFPESRSSVYLPTTLLRGV